MTALPYQPADYVKEWKTADKVGVENVYVALNKEGIVAMAMACFKQFNDNWKAGDAVKKELKSMHNQVIDVSDYVVIL